MFVAWESQLFIMIFAEDKVLYCHYRVGHERQKRNEHSADIHSSAAVKAERQYKRCRQQIHIRVKAADEKAHYDLGNYCDTYGGDGVGKVSSAI